jgi:transaldolase
MTQELIESVKGFILNDIDLSKSLSFQSNKFWESLASSGSEIWLDTGDMDEASQLWCKEMSALTTNNTLLNKEIQKGIYDELISEANHFLSHLDEKERIVEIAFILNARHALKLAEKFGGKVSVELHTDMAHDIEKTVSYAERFFDICPEHFIIKIPLTPAGYIATRKVREKGIPVNFTLNFSARQNLIATVFSKPSYVNVFLGRQNALVINNHLGNGEMIGEKSTLASQRVVQSYAKYNAEPTRQIAASIRDASQIDHLAGVDVFTIPTKVADEAIKNLSSGFVSRRDRDYAIHLYPNVDPKAVQIEKLWQYSEAEHNFAHRLDADPPESADEFIQRAYEAGLKDLFPDFSGEAWEILADDGKIPVLSRWQDQIKVNQMSLDALLNASGLASFASDQAALDNRIRSIITNA